MPSNTPGGAAPRQPQAPKTIWQKIFEIQKAIKTFNNTDGSDKLDPKTGKSAYIYTPGWKITETVRSLMDDLGLMLIPDIRFNRIDNIEYPVYKMINGTPMSFTKKEIHIALDADFTWIDPVTGETAGPYHIVASGANGTDKSTASALALAERYFLLKFFHISTHEADDEPDAHDSDNLPGIPKSQQRTATPQDACRSVPAQGTPYAQQQPAYGGQGNAPYAPAQQEPYRGAPQGRPAVQQPQMTGGAQVNIYPSAPQYIVPGPQPQAPQGFNDKEPNTAAAVSELSNFEKGTLSHQQVLNQCLGKLSAAGINCTGQNFIQNLTEAAQAVRENRMPRYV